MYVAQLHFTQTLTAKIAGELGVLCNKDFGLKYIAVCFFLCLNSLECKAESIGYMSIELLYDSKSVDECKFLGDMIGSKTNVSLSSHEGEAIVLGLLNGWRHEAYLSGANVLNILTGRPRV